VHVNKLDAGRCRMLNFPDNADFTLTAGRSAQHSSGQYGSKLDFFKRGRAAEEDRCDWYIGAWVSPC
jgi:hypothetical protein